MSPQRFTATLVRGKTGAHLEVPFDPDEVWGVRERHYVTGSIAGHPFRGCLDSDWTPCRLPIGPAWLRDNEIPNEAAVEVVLEPDGHQVDSLAPDIAAALREEPQARAFFESVAPFYRNNYIRWIEEARRPETRSARIAEAVRLLKAGHRQR